MYYQAQAYQMNTEHLLVDLGIWDEYEDAQCACETREDQALVFWRRDERIWSAQCTTCRYQIVRSKD